jgi:formylglycine-generating enzyme required for sulfatase activity
MDPVLRAIVPLAAVMLLLVAVMLLGVVVPSARADSGAALSCPEGMAPIPAGTYRIGAGGQRPEEGPPALVRLSPFCIGTREVTNRQFAAFVEATGYRTVAERPLSTEQFPGLSAAERAPGSVVFHPLAPGEPVGPIAGWQWVSGADWSHP